ncbi:MAG: CapA family protein, partial [Halobacteriaceae archaeon]
MSQTSIGLTGDVMLGRLVDDRHRSQMPDAVWGNLQTRLQELDGLLINLESVLSTRGEQWTETRRPFHFRADPQWALPALTTIDVDFASLANNHALDYNEIALQDTISGLEEENIHHAGAGTPQTAWEPAVFTINDYTIAVIAATDNTPEYATTDQRLGVAHTAMDIEDEDSLDPIRNAIQQAKEYQPDFVIASLHWGPNMETVPAKQYRKFGRWLVDNGIDLIHGHSAHVFQGVEVYNQTPILYDCGDFVDDYRVDPDLRNDRSFLYEVRISNGQIAAIQLHPVAINNCQVNYITDDIDWWDDTLRERCRPFNTADRIERVD